MPAPLPQDLARGWVDHMRGRWLNIPWRHKGRDHSGVDCAGLLVCSATERGLIVKDNLNYRYNPDYKQMRAGLLEQMVPVKASDLRIGDILWLRWERDAFPCHLAAISNFSISGRPWIIHAYREKGRSVEMVFPDNWVPSISLRLRWEAWAD